jgi:hypothetical protein
MEWLMRPLAAINLVLAVCVCLTAMQLVPQLGEPDVLFGLAAFAALVVSLTVSSFSGH